MDETTVYTLKHILDANKWYSDKYLKRYLLSIIFPKYCCVNISG